ncbi:hypothetical protein HID58_008302 [Brassica napus]|uniref:Uncharacterized protein n=1 Tax=Brassica napus TaxID=3708 RepID=A0ABQ8DP88_BRANA|nr:hypothetical protein HID58_008302 [Brassica napus]
MEGDVSICLRRLFANATSETHIYLDSETAAKQCYYEMCRVELTILDETEEAIFAAFSEMIKLTTFTLLKLGNTWVEGREDGPKDNMPEAISLASASAKLGNNNAKETP